MSPEAAYRRASSRLRDYLRGRRLRLTEERLRLLQAVVAQSGHFDADEISARMARARRPVSRATVYRNLALFEQCGILRKSIVGQGRGLYENAIGRPLHDHLVCSACGRIDEFEDPRIEAAQNGLARSSGFRLLSRVYEVIGICPDCQKRTAGPQQGDRP